MDNDCNAQGLATRDLAAPEQSASGGVARRASHVWMLGLALLAFVVRVPGLFGGFVFDDALSFETRTRADFSRIPAFFTTDQSSFFGSNFYRPVLNVWYELLFAVFGAHAVAWHALSILLHVACTLLVFRLALIIVEQPLVAAVAAGVFAAHPAHVEAVTWASAVADPLWTMLALASALMLLRWMRQGSALWFGGAMLAGAAAIFTKETAVVTPVLLLVTALLFRDRSRRVLPTALATAPLFLAAAVFLSVRQSVLHGFSHALTVASDTQMVLTWPAALLFYLRHMIWPSQVMPFYPLQIVKNLRSSEFLLPALGALAIFALLGFLLWRAAGWRRFCVCVAWTFVPLAPALYLKALAPFELVHDRFLYAPLVGFSLAAALVLRWLADRIGATTQFRLLPAVAITLIALLGMQSVNLALWWQNNKLLFTRALMVTPENPKALNGLATAKMAEGRYQDAVPLLRRTLELNPQDSGALFALGRIAWAQGDDVSAAKYLSRALRVQPRYDMWLHLASIHLHMKQVEAAEADVRNAEAMNSGAAGVHVAMGAVLLSKGDSAGAIQEFEQELRNFPQSEPARAGIAQAKRIQAR